MRSVTIGVYLDQDVRRLESTLAGLRAHTPAPFDLALLPAHVDAATSASSDGRSDSIASTVR